MTPDASLLELVIDRIIPGDDDPGALLLGTPRFVRDRLAERPGLEAEVAAGLAALPEGFGGLSERARDAVLRDVEAQGWFRELVELTQEGFWADPGNGGNDAARSWRMIGYEPGLPDRDIGPEAA
jgi:hypothetical protein